MTAWLFALPAALFVAALLHAPVSAAPPPTVPHVDLGRYLGIWHEVARIPNRFQRQCASYSMARYRRLTDKRIEVVNSCLGEDGKVQTAEGVARVVDSSNAKLEVSFVKMLGFHLFWSDYWILALGPEYQYSIVGSPDRRYGWVLSRSPSLPPKLWKHVQEQLVELGYDPQAFKETPRPPLS